MQSLSPIQSKGDVDIVLIVLNFKDNSHGNEEVGGGKDLALHVELNCYQQFAKTSLKKLDTSFYSKARVVSITSTTKLQIGNKSKLLH